jgi:hypothetical protein
MTLNSNDAKPAGKTIAAIGFSIIRGKGITICEPVATSPEFKRFAAWMTVSECSFPDTAASHARFR